MATQYYFKVANETINVQSGKHDSPNITISMKESDYLDMVNGKLNGQMAFMSGKLKVEQFATDGVGLPTLLDIKAELARPGRDPREDMEPFSFAEGVEKVSDLEPGMSLPGVVTNVTAFGAFVDVGVHQDGLVHISQLSDRYVEDPHEVVKVTQQVRVTVLNVDLERNRISLSMRK